MTSDLDLARFFPPDLSGPGLVILPLALSLLSLLLLLWVSLRLTRRLAAVRQRVDLAERQDTTAEAVAEILRKVEDLQRRNEELRRLAEGLGQLSGRLDSVQGELSVWVTALAELRHRLEQAGRQAASGDADAGRRLVRVEAVTGGLVGVPAELRRLAEQLDRVEEGQREAERTVAALQNTVARYGTSQVEMRRQYECWKAETQAARAAGAEADDEDNGMPEGMPAEEEFPQGPVAVYWDFENIHTSVPVGLRPTDPDPRRHPRRRRTVNVEAVMDYIAELGEVVINRAYADWARFSAYAPDLLKHSVDLVQMFPRGSHAKNGADIRMALDAIEDIHHFGHVRYVVIIGGDSDFISLAQKIRQSGRHVIGIGVREATNEYFIESCNRFKLYRTLVEEVQPPATPEAIEDLELAKQTLVKAVRLLADRHGSKWAHKGGLRPVMQRIDPSFDERNCGFTSFNLFVRACGDVVEVRRGEHDHMIAVRADVPVAGEPRPEEPRQDTYARVLRQHRIRLVPVAWRRAAMQHLVAVFRDSADGTVTTWPELKTRLAERLEKAGLDHDPTWIAKLKDLFFYSRLFQRVGPEKAIGLAAGATAESILDATHRFLVQRLVSQSEPPHDPAAIAELLFDAEADAHLAEVESLLEASVAEEADSNPGPPPAPGPDPGNGEKAAAAIPVAEAEPADDLSEDDLDAVPEVLGEALPEEGGSEVEP